MNRNLRKLLSVCLVLCMVIIQIFTSGTVSAAQSKQSQRILDSGKNEPLVETTKNGTNKAADLNVVIANVADLKNAIKNQKDGQTWIIKAGNYGLTPIDNYTAEGQTGWYMAITADNLTIKGEGMPVIYGDEYTANGIWSSQNLVTVLGNDVKIDGIWFMPKIQVNKTIEVAGKDFTITDCKFTENNISQNTNGDIDYKGDGGALYFSGDKGKVSVKGNSFSATSIVFDSMANAKSVAIENNVFEKIPEGAYGIGNVTWSNPATLTMADVTVRNNDFVVKDTDCIIKNRMDGKFTLTGNKVNGKPIAVDEWGKYIYIDTQRYGCKNAIVSVNDNEYNALNDIHISTLEQLEYALNNQTDGQKWYINPGTYTLTGTNVKYTAPNLGGFFGVITANNITIKNVGDTSKTIINSNGNPNYTGTFIVLGNNVTIDGITFQPNLNNPNRTVDIAGANATVMNCQFTESGGALYIPAEFLDGSLGVLTITGNTFDDTMLCFDSAKTADSIIVSNNTFNMGASNAYAIGNVTWASPETSTMAPITVSNNKFNTHETGAPIIRNRMTGSFILTGNTVDGSKPSDWAPYILLQNNKYSTVTDPSVIVDGIKYISGGTALTNAYIGSWYNLAYTNTPPFSYLDTEFQIDTNQIKWEDIKSIKVALYNNSDIMGYRYSTGSDLNNLIFGEDGITKYPSGTNMQWISCALTQRDAEQDNGYWLSSACALTSDSDPQPNKIIVTISTKNSVYICLGTK